MEFVARAGTTSQFSFGDDEKTLTAYGWYKQNAYDAGVHHPLEVGLKRPNPGGLFDVHGNVWEWVEQSVLWHYSEERRDEPGREGFAWRRIRLRRFRCTVGFSATNSRLIRSNYVIGFRVVKGASVDVFDGSRYCGQAKFAKPSPRYTHCPTRLGPAANGLLGFVRPLTGWSANSESRKRWRSPERRQRRLGSSSSTIVAKDAEFDLTMGSLGRLHRHGSSIHCTRYTVP